MAEADRENVVEFTAARQPDTVDQLGEMAAELARLRQDPGLRMVELLDQIEALDQRGAGPVSELTAQYVANGTHAESAAQLRVWEAVSLYSQRLAAAHLYLVRLFQTYARGWSGVEDRLPVVIALALRATSLRLKWMRMRYRQITPDIWQALSQLWSYIEDKGLSLARVSVDDAETTLRREFVKPLMFTVSAVDSLQPAEIDIAHKLIDRIAERFDVQRYPDQGCYFLFDVDRWTMPERYLPGGTIELGSIFFGPADAIAELEALSAQLAEGTMSTEQLELGAADQSEVIAVMSHLERHWALNRPERREQRRRASSAMSVVRGYEQIARRVIGADGGEPAGEGGIESWGVDNESEAGYGAVVAVDLGERLHIGELLGVRAEDSRVWAVGVIRRLATKDAARRYVGIEILARGVQAVKLKPCGDEEQGGELRLMLPSHISDGLGHAEISLLLPSGGFLPEVSLKMTVYDTGYVLEPLMVTETGDNFEVGRYRIVERVG